ncbi:MAG: LacI family DNA-binding transcriptional regulator, partial [Flavobacteriaceae bacterium]|nr:LacI family DNA-binding transcriptional regulator [Flavobacteriaceae bacterium]
QKITIKTIAKELGVSTSTVSKALSDSHEISTETKERIRAFAKYSNYKPNSLALQLRNQKTKVIGVIIPKIVHHFFSTVISGIENTATERGYNVMICFSNNSYKREVENLEVLTNGSVDGLLVSLSKETLENHESLHFQNLIENETPLVMFDRVDDRIQCDKVIVDDKGAGYKATKYLLESGCKKIGLITTPQHITVGALRRDGYERALREKGISIDRKMIAEVDEEKVLHDEISRLFEQEIDAIFAVNEIYAAVAIRIAKEKGLRIPQDVSVIGFTDGLISEYSSPSITTIVQHGYTMGKQAAELLLDRIENKNNIKEPQTKVISSNLKVRESSL